MKPWVRREPVPLNPPTLPAWLRWISPARYRYKVAVRRWDDGRWWWSCLRCTACEPHLTQPAAFGGALDHYARCILPARLGLEYYPL